MTKTEADAVFARLAALGVALLHAEYSGDGDSGQFDGLTAYDAEGKWVGEVDFDKPVGEEDALVVNKVTKRLNNEKFQTFSEELEQMTWGAIDNAGHGGWENNEGGFGKLVFDVAERTVVLEHSNYTGATEDSTNTVYSADPNEVEETAS